MAAVELSWLCSAKNFGLQWFTLPVQCFFEVPVMLSAGEKAIAEIMRVAQQQSSQVRNVPLQCKWDSFWPLSTFPSPWSCSSATSDVYKTLRCLHWIMMSPAHSWARSAECDPSPGVCSCVDGIQIHKEKPSLLEIPLFQSANIRKQMTCKKIMHSYDDSIHLKLIPCNWDWLFT